jgi:hypothetical protein
MGNLKARSLVVALAVTVGALALSSTAFAGGTHGGKNLKSGVQNGQGGTGINDARGASSASASSASGDSADRGLPFTRLDLPVLIGGGLLLIASGVTFSGLVLRRVRI